MNRDNLSFYEPTSDRRAVAIVSVPISLGSDQSGGRHAPEHVYRAGLKHVLHAIHRDISEEHAIPVPKPVRVVSAGVLKSAKHIVRVAEKTSSVVERAAQRGDVALVLGGDHSAALGSIAGASSAIDTLGLIYIDAHPDCTTDQTTISGNVHGMITSTAVGAGHELLRGLMRRTIDPKNVVYIALKDIDAAEVAFLREYDMTCITMLDIAEHGLAPAFRAIDALRVRATNTWVSMDMDAIDKEYAPGVGMPNDGGLTRREALALAQYIGTRSEIAGIDVVEIAPEKDIDNRTAQLALEIIARLLGGEYSWYSAYMDEYRATNVTTSAVVRGKRSAT